MENNYGAGWREVIFFMNKLLTTYWIDFGETLHSQYGATAYSLEDAKYLFTKEVFHGNELPPIKHVPTNIQFKDLDQNHVALNMGPISERGIWYPLIGRF